jgi:serine/threonine protein kinase
MSLVSGTKLGPYEILSQVGAGGMGEVYRARDTRLGRIVAIKILHGFVSNDPGRRARFEREAQTISGLSHANICALFDIGQQDGVDYLVLEYLEGETLADRIARGPIPISETLRIGADIAAALEAAHRHGIVHRDLKPANVVLTKAGTKLLDFGLARTGAPFSAAADSPTASLSLTGEGVILGTLQYMAPEQLETKDADARTDIFALGELLYEMATGRPPFRGTSRASMIAAILNAEPEPISVRQPLSTQGLDRLVQNCLAKDPDQRCQSAHDVLLDLKSIADDASHAEPANSASPLRKKQLIALTLLATLSTAALLAIGC